MLDLDLARSLEASGLVWSPACGDRFVVRERGMDAEVFVLSDFTIEVHELPTGPVIGFNGTTEWAMDSVDLSQVLWLPREDQLRELLGSRFRRLESGPTGWTLAATVGDREQIGRAHV